MPQHFFKESPFVNMKYASNHNSSLTESSCYFLASAESQRMSASSRKYIKNCIAE